MRNYMVNEKGAAQNHVLEIVKGPSKLDSWNSKGLRSKAETQDEKWCNWRALIEELVMEVHSTRVQWPAPLQGPHLLICGSPLPGKYAWVVVELRSRSDSARGCLAAVADFVSKNKIPSQYFTINVLLLGPSFQFRQAELSYQPHAYIYPTWIPKLFFCQERWGERPREKCRPEVTHVNVWCKHRLRTPTRN